MKAPFPMEMPFSVKFTMILHPSSQPAFCAGLDLHSSSFDVVLPAGVGVSYQV
jgi:hypothetical protein